MEGETGGLEKLVLLLRYTIGDDGTSGGSFISTGYS